MCELPYLVFSLFLVISGPWAFVPYAVSCSCKAMVTRYAIHSSKSHRNLYVLHIHTIKSDQPLYYKPKRTSTSGVTTSVIYGVSKLLVWRPSTFNQLHVTCFKGTVQCCLRSLAMSQICTFVLNENHAIVGCNRGQPHSGIDWISKTAQDLYTIKLKFRILKTNHNCEI